MFSDHAQGCYTDIGDVTPCEECQATAPLYFEFIGLDKSVYSERTEK